MVDYNSFDYLCNEPFFIEGIGNIKSPTLRDIRKITYKTFLVFLNLILCNHQDYIKLLSKEEEYNSLTEEEKKLNSLYNLMLYTDANLLFSILSFFIIDEIEFDKITLTFKTYQLIDGKKEYIGHIGNDNFDDFKDFIQCILGLKKYQEEIKFKNNTAKKIFEKLKKHTQEQKKVQDENYTLDNMIRKYCTHNKVGINILNVWDMTYYQFTNMFKEYCNGRQYDFNDMMAANTFSYKKSTDYKPLEYIKILNDN